MSQGQQFNRHKVDKQPSDKLAIFEDMIEAQQCVSSDEVANADKLQAVLDQLPAAVLLIDPQGKVEQCNPTAVALFNQPIIGEKWLTIIKREIVPSEENEYQLQLRNGRVITVATQSMGKFPGQVLLVNDVTEKHQLQERLHLYERLSSMGKMAASLAHQLRTPLATALLYSKHLCDEKIAIEKKRRFSQKLVTSLHLMEAQIRDMLIFTKGGSVCFEQVKISSIINAAIQDLEIALGSTQSNIFYHRHHDHEINCNQQGLIGVIQNCINNSLEADEKGVDIHINVKKIDNTTVEIIIADNGPGMDHTLLQKAQQAFFTTKAKGTGLGLAVAHVVATAHGGKLLLESSPGSGTVVKLRLPMAKE